MSFASSSWIHSEFKHGFTNRKDVKKWGLRRGGRVLVFAVVIVDLWPDISFSVECMAVSPRDGVRKASRFPTILVTLSGRGMMMVSQ